METPIEQLSPSEIAWETLEHARYLRRVLADFEPLLSVLKGNGTGSAVALAGLRRGKRGRDAVQEG